jgi:hypothetical protein
MVVGWKPDGTSNVEKPAVPEAAKKSKKAWKRRGKKDAGKTNVESQDPKTQEGLSSRESWVREKILSLYPTPTEQQLPSKLVPASKQAKSKQKSYNWMETPHAYLESGLGIPSTSKFILLKDTMPGNANFRVVLVAKWGRLKETTIGDGKTKVHEHPFLANSGNRHE